MITNTGISVSTCKGPVSIPLENIIRIQSISNYSRIYFADNSYPLTVARILQWFENNLPQEMFLRTHRAHLVNRTHILHAAFPAKCLHLSNGETVRISKRRKQWVKQRICA